MLVSCFCSVISCLRHSVKKICVSGCARCHCCTSVAGLLKKHLASRWSFFRSEVVQLNLLSSSVTAGMSTFVAAEFARFASALFVRMRLSTLCQITSDRLTSAHIVTTLLRPAAQICHLEWLPLGSTMPTSLSALSEVFNIGHCPRGLCKNVAQLSQHLIRMSLLSDLFYFSVSSGLQLYLRLENWPMIDAKVLCTAFAGVEFPSLSLLRTALSKSCSMKCTWDQNAISGVYIFRCKAEFGQDFSG